MPNFTPKNEQDESPFSGSFSFSSGDNFSVQQSYPIPPVSGDVVGGSFTYKPPAFPSTFFDDVLSGIEPSKPDPESDPDPESEYDSVFCDCSLPGAPHFPSDHRAVKEAYSLSYKNYVVSWEIDADEYTSAEIAALAIRTGFIKPNSVATVFTVKDKATGEITVVDLDPYAS